MCTTLLHIDYWYTVQYTYNVILLSEKLPQNVHASVQKLYTVLLYIVCKHMKQLIFKLFKGR